MDAQSILAINAVKGIEASASRGQAASTAHAINQTMRYMQAYTETDSKIEFPVVGSSSRKRDPKPPRHKTKIGRNEQCPCGSGKKFKRCHLAEVKGEK